MVLISMIMIIQLRLLSAGVAAGFAETLNAQVVSASLLFGSKPCVLFLSNYMVLFCCFRCYQVLIAACLATGELVRVSAEYMFTVNLYIVGLVTSRYSGV